MFFNLFRNNKSEETPSSDDKLIVRLSYCITEKSRTPVVDVELEDYNDECIDGLCKILDILSEEGSFIETVGIIKDAMMADNQEGYLMKIYSHIATNNKLNKRSKENEPCIKPSDVLR